MGTLLTAMRMSVRYAAAPRRLTADEATKATMVMATGSHQRRRMMAQYSRSSTVAATISQPRTTNRSAARHTLRSSAHPPAPMLDTRAQAMDAPTFTPLASAHRPPGAHPGAGTALPGAHGAVLGRRHA